jgi:hypothetical protein
MWTVPARLTVGSVHGTGADRAKASLIVALSQVNTGDRPRAVQAGGLANQVPIQGRGWYVREHRPRRAQGLAVSGDDSNGVATMRDDAVDYRVAPQLAAARLQAAHQCVA